MDMTELRKGKKRNILSEKVQVNYKKPGRKPLSADKIRRQKILVSLNDGEYKKLLKHGREYVGLTLPQVVRELLKRHNYI